MYIIAVLAFISILCLEIIQLPSDTHSFSVLRSVGMSKGQLALMQSFETIILGIPAILLGIPLGAGLTWLALRLMLYSGSVDIQVYISFETMFFILGLWLAAILLSRFIIFVFTLRVPMIGRFQMNTSKSKGARLIRSGSIVLLLCVFSVGVIFTGMEASTPEYWRQYYSNCPSYILTKDKKDVFGRDLSTIYPRKKVDNPNYEPFYVNLRIGTVPLSDMDNLKLEDIPGISYVYSMSELRVGLSFDGLSEEDVFSAAAEHYSILYHNTWEINTLALLAINDNEWADVLDFGSDRTAFHNGEFVYVSVPVDGHEYQMPNGEAELYIYNEHKAKIKLTGTKTVTTRNMYIPTGINSRNSMGLRTPYTVICSEQFLRDLLDTLPKGERWGYIRSVTNLDMKGCVPWPI